MFSLDQFAVLRTTRGTLGDGPFLVRPLFNRQHAAALRSGTVNTQDALRVIIKTADHSTRVAIAFGRRDSHATQNTVTFAQRRITIAQCHKDDRLRASSSPFQRTGKQITIAVNASDFQHRHRRQVFSIAIARLTLGQMTLVFQLAQHTFQINALSALDIKRLGDVALGGFGGMVGNPLQDFGFGRDLFHVPRLSTQATRG